MPRREIIHIDKDLCDGCGDCVVACAEGAIEIRDGVAELVSSTYCDGLGVCLGHCPQDAITLVEAEAEPFDEVAVHRRLTERSTPTWSRSLRVHGGAELSDGGCPGGRSLTLPERPAVEPSSAEVEPSRLRQWPVQLHLLSPTAPALQEADLLLSADCVAYSVGGFHRRFLGGRCLAIACPKLDSHQEVYLDKLVRMIDEAGISSLRVMVMEVPCCGGLVRLAEEAVSRARRTVPLEVVVIGVAGDVVGESSVPAAGGQEGACDAGVC